MTRQEKERLKKYVGQKVKVIYIESHVKSEIGILTKVDRDNVYINGKPIAFQNYWRMIYKIILLPAQEIIFENKKVDFEYGALPRNLISRAREIEREKSKERGKNKIPLDKFLGI